MGYFLVASCRLEQWNIQLLGGEPMKGRGDKNGIQAFGVEETWDREIETHGNLYGCMASIRFDDVGRNHPPEGGNRDLFMGFPWIYTGWSIGILVKDYYDPYITG